MALVKEWLTPFPRTPGEKIRFQSALLNSSRLPEGKWRDTLERLRKAAASDF